MEATMTLRMILPMLLIVYQHPLFLCRQYSLLHHVSRCPAVLLAVEHRCLSPRHGAHWKTRRAHPGCQGLSSNCNGLGLPRKQPGWPTVLSVGCETRGTDAHVNECGPIRQLMCALAVWCLLWTGRGLCHAVKSLEPTRL